MKTTHCDTDIEEVSERYGFAPVERQVMLDVHMLARLAITARDERDAAQRHAVRALDLCAASTAKLRALRAAVGEFCQASAAVRNRPLDDAAISAWTTALAVLDPLMEDQP